MKKRVLVTGGTGFIGRALLSKLSCRDDLECVVLSRSQNDGAGNLSFYNVDISDLEAVLEFKKNAAGFDSIIHLASLNPGATQKSHRADENLSQNLLSTVNLLNLVSDELESFIYASTLDVYGVPVFTPMTEEHPTEPETYYGVAKLASEKFLRIALKEKGIPLTTLRLSQVYGPGEPPIKAIPRFIGDVMEGKSPVIYGDGEDIRDYIYLDDAVDAVIKALETRTDGLFNIAGGVGTSIKDVLQIILDIGKSDLVPTYKARQKTRVDIVFDITKVKEGLGWSPAITLKKGLRREYDSFVKEYEIIS